MRKKSKEINIIPSIRRIAPNALAYPIFIRYTNDNEQFGEKSMQTNRISPKTKNAVLLGGMCSVAYLAVYIARNALSVVSPQILQLGVFTTEQLGTLSSVYFIAYAIGQLINGIVGNRVKGKYMISFGLILSAAGLLAIPYLEGKIWAVVAFYGFSGFCLAMIYGPMVRLVAESVPDYATQCSVGYTLSSFLGSPVAGLLAAGLTWRWVFLSSGSILMVMGAVCLLVFRLFEKKGIICYPWQGQQKKSAAGSVKLLIKRQIIRFTFVSVLTGVVRTTVVFWLPTYLSSYLQFAPETASLIYTVSTLALSCSIFLAVFAYERLKRNMRLALLLSFAAAAVCFLAIFFVHQPALNVVLLVLAILFGNSASNLMWSCYCPGLHDTGMVSGATGYLDFCSYMAASVASAVFANAVGDIGWSGLILAWTGLMFCGVIVALWPSKQTDKRSVLL